MKLGDKLMRLEQTVRTLGDFMGIGVPTSFGVNQDLDTWFFIGRRNNAEGNPRNTPEMFQSHKWTLTSRYFYSKFSYIQEILLDDNRLYRRVYGERGWTCWKEM